MKISSKLIKIEKKLKTTLERFEDLWKHEKVTVRASQVIIRILGKIMGLCANLGD